MVRNGFEFRTSRENTIFTGPLFVGGLGATASVPMYHAGDSNVF